MFQLAIGRPPAAHEIQMMLDYLALANERPSGVEYDEPLANEVSRVTARLGELDAIIKQRLAEAGQNDPEFEKLSQGEQQQKVAKAEVDERNALNQQLNLLNPKAGPPEPWTELAQSLFSLKEFSYLR